MMVTVTTSIFFEVISLSRQKPLFITEMKKEIKTLSTNFFNRQTGNIKNFFCSLFIKMKIYKIHVTEKVSSLVIFAPFNIVSNTLKDCFNFHIKLNVKFDEKE